MRHFFSTSIALLAFAFLTQVAFAQGDTVFLEDFEDSVVLYTTSEPDDLSDIANSDYFGRIDDTSGLPTDIEYSNQQGNGFYGVQDTDGTPSGNIDQITFEILDISISNFEDLQFSVFLAEDTANDGNEDWDVPSSVLFAAQIDGTGFFDFLAIESSSNAAGNLEPRIDTDFDGIGDGDEITDVFTEFTVDFGDVVGLASEGTIFDLRIIIDSLDTGDEDIAIDSLRLFGTNTAVPEPSGIALILLVGATTLLRRKR